MGRDVDDAQNRARGTLLGLAMGDAMGMPGQTLTREQIAAQYGRITDFTAPVDDHPVSHGLRAAQVTDDTEQSLLLARRLIVDPGRFDDAGWARDLLDWEADIRARGLRDLLGPSSKAALDALLAGANVAETGRNGTTNGASMRIAPVGIATPPDPAQLVARVVRACRVTHNTGEAIAAASAVAMIISQGVDGADFDTALPAALAAAGAGQREGYCKGCDDIAARIAKALELAQSGDEALVAATIGTSVASHESVPAAFAMVRLADGCPWEATRIAANIGDDTDTIGAIAGAMTGACCGASSLPADRIEVLLAANNLDIDALADALLHQRRTLAGAIT